MQIPILVEQVQNNGYRARSGEPLALSADGETADEAITKLQALVAAKLQSGARLLSMPLPPNDNPWLRGAGMFKDDPLFDEWQQEIADQRKAIDADPNVL